MNAWNYVIGMRTMKGDNAWHAGHRAQLTLDNQQPLMDSDLTSYMRARRILNVVRRGFSYDRINFFSCRHSCEWEKELTDANLQKGEHAVEKLLEHEQTKARE